MSAPAFRSFIEATIRSKDDCIQIDERPGLYKAEDYKLLAISIKEIDKNHQITDIMLREMDLNDECIRNLASIEWLKALDISCNPKITDESLTIISNSFPELE